MKVNNSYIAVAKDGNNQKFNAYPRAAQGDYLLRFFVDDYEPNGTNRPQWAGKGCSFKTQEEAIRAGYQITSGIKKAGSFEDVKLAVETMAAYKKVFNV